MADGAAHIPLAEQIAEVKREIGLRRRVYPGFIAAHRLKQADGDRQIARLEAVLATLEELAAKERLL